MPHGETHFNSHDGLQLYEQHWLPGQAVRAVVVVVHGFTEHSGRYARVAEELNEQGYAVYAMDLRGHGRSEGRRCYAGRFEDYLRDLDLLVENVRLREPDRPLILFGHCLGGLIASRWCITRQPAIQGLALSAPALRLRADLYPWLRPFAIFVGQMFPRLRVVRMGFRNISRDPAVVEAVRADPLVFHDRFPVRTISEILRAMRLTAAAFDQIRLPVVVLHGTADRVCAPEGSRELCRRAGSRLRTLHLYEGLYHEVLNEPERAEVMADLLDWLERRVESGVR
jgi:alpha-beta hydrolase superfamily lysophospholipase